MERKRFQEYKRLMRLLGGLILIIAVAIIFVNTWSNYYNMDAVFPFYQKGNLLLSLLYILFFVIFIYLYDGIHYGFLRNRNVVFSQILALLCANTIMYMEIVLLTTRLVYVVPIIKMTCIQILVIIIWSTLWGNLFKIVFPPNKITVLYEDYDPKAFLLKVNSRKDKYYIERIVKVSDSWDNLTDTIDNSEAILIYDVHSELRNKILKCCYEKGKRIYITPKISDILVHSSENMHLFDTPLYLLRNDGLYIEERIAKRLMDIIVSLLVLIVTSPIMIAVAIAIKAYDGGPVFFKQKRCTINGKVFEIHKFRSMIVNAEKDGMSIPASERDPRITPIGRFIRATRLDELPQAIDILKGDMSLVGPRPERVEHVEKYTKEIPEFAYRLKVKGGLTGYAQIYGKYNTTAYDKLKLDLIYVQNYSILLDIKLIIKTIKVVFMKESTEGFDEEQIKEIQSRDA